MADNLAKGSKELEGKSRSLEGGKKVVIEKQSEKDSKVSAEHSPTTGTSKINERGKGSGDR